MNFLEKDLETIISENYMACLDRGLSINQKYYEKGIKYRQLNLAPYGIADLVNIRYSAEDDAFFAQVIELKKGKVDTAAYLQAKRYQTALLGVLEQINKLSPGPTSQVFISTVLIGNEVEKAGDFVFALNDDHSCTAFLYTYAFDGIHFTPLGKDWRMGAAADSQVLQSLSTELHRYRADVDASFCADIERQEEESQDDLSSFGDFSKVLVLTPEGVHVNQYLLDRSLEDNTDGIF